ncbi:acetyltransferase [Companilactobacillus muriivasis]|uniref:acetyltransferase n=1 Tax=Companilactobacillus muriivasis TaxID=3081444 RepID=UPI0030C78025
MKIVIVTQRNPELIEKLTAIWESSVRATHTFLTEQDIQNFKKTLPAVLTKISHLIIAIDSQSQPIAFMGINEPEIDMLFIDDKNRGQGIGRALINYGIANYQANQITVNEQNPQAKGFYEHMGFVTYQRQATDDQGKPFPILRMKLKK